MQHRSRFARRLCVAVDAKGYGSRDDVAQYDIQALLPDVLEEAATAAGLDRGRWQIQPSGDGEIALVPPDQPEPLVVDDFIRELYAALQLRNHGRFPDFRLRLRVAMDFGIAYPAPSGFAGEAVVATARLLASDGLHRALAGTDDIDLAVALSTRVYQTVVHRHTSLTADQFYRVSVNEKEYSADAWIRVLQRGSATPPAQPDQPFAEVSPSRSAHSKIIPRTKMENNFYAQVDAGVIGINFAAAPDKQ